MGHKPRNGLVQRAAISDIIEQVKFVVKVARNHGSLRRRGGEAGDDRRNNAELGAALLNALVVKMHVKERAWLDLDTSALARQHRRRRRAETEIEGDVDDVAPENRLPQECHIATLARARARGLVAPFQRREATNVMRGTKKGNQTFMLLAADLLQEHRVCIHIHEPLPDAGPAPGPVKEQRAWHFRILLTPLVGKNIPAKEAEGSGGGGRHLSVHSERGLLEEISYWVEEGNVVV